MRDSTANPELLVLGSTGLLGQAMLAEANVRGWPTQGAARSGADHAVDVSDLDALERLIRQSSCSVIVNCAALVDLDACERHPDIAYAVNARPPALLARLARELGFKLVQISSDHFFTGDGSAAHDEQAPVQLLNEYARTKYAGEAFTLTAPTALVVRTNIVGLRGWPERPTFVEWALDALLQARPISLFDDFFTSSIHAGDCAQAVLDLVSLDASGLLNIASSQVSSKRAFVEALAEAAAMRAPNTSAGSIRELVPRRAESLGLDVARAERLLQRHLPDLHDTVRAVVAERYRRLAHR
jgi:dTDP-4-dehydrorhamnose reductase